MRVAVLSTVLFMAVVGCSTAPVGTPAEHVAICVQDPAAFVTWWTQNLGFKVTLRRASGSAFIADAGGHVALEVYGPGKGRRAPDYHRQDILQLHFGFATANMDADVRRLIDAGAVLVCRESAPGLEGAMLRDPQGVPFQLVSREKSILK